MEHMDHEYSAERNPTIFGKILRGEIPADRVWDDEHCIAFADIDPQAPHHYLVIPKRRLERLADMTAEHRTLLGHLLWVAHELAREKGFLEDGFRTVINSGEKAGQSVFHLHVHVLGGRRFAWPPG